MVRSAKLVLYITGIPRFYMVLWFKWGQWGDIAPHSLGHLCMVDGGNNGISSDKQQNCIDKNDGNESYIS